MNEVLTENQKKFIDNIAVKEGFNDYELNVTGGTDKGDGYLGTIKFIEIRENPTGKSQKLILKVAFTEPALRDKISISDVYKRENFMYGVIFRDFSELQEEFQVKNKFDGTAKYFGGFTEVNEECLVLENLHDRGFRLWNRRIPMDSHHVRAVMEQYGRFHALSFAMKKLKPDVFSDKTKNLFDVMTKTEPEEQLKQMVKFCMNKAYKVVDGNVALTERIHRLSTVMEKFLLGLDEMNDKYMVLMHGDCWCNNMMFKYEDEETQKPSKVYLLDWQLSKLGSPFQDICYFFYACSSEDCMKNFMVYLKAYYNSLSKMLEQFGLKVEEIMTFEEALAQWKIFAKYGLNISILIIQIMLTEKEEVQGLQEVDKDESLLSAFSKDITNNQEYNRRLTILIKHMVENDFI